MHINRSHQIICVRVHAKPNHCTMLTRPLHNKPCNAKSYAKQTMQNHTVCITTMQSQTVCVTDHVVCITEHTKSNRYENRLHNSPMLDVQCISFCYCCINLYTVTLIAHSYLCCHCLFAMITVK